VTGGGAADGEWDFFVSYTQVDRPWAEWIAWTLEEAGRRVLVQAWDSVPGSHWPDLVHRGVRRSGSLVAVVSPAYLESIGGAAEWHAMWAADIGGRRRRIVPVLVARCDAEALGLLGGRSWIDLRELSAGPDDEVARSRLLDGMAAAAAGRAKPAGPVSFPGRGEPTSTAPGRVSPALDVLPGLPARFVPRDEAVAAVRGLLADPGGGLVVGLVGMGGAGKSTLARALVHDPWVRAAFPDGIVWVEVNSAPDVTAVVAQVLAAFGDAAPVFDAAEGSGRLRRLLAGAACLVVADNVWDVGVLRALRLSGRARLLVTTRSRDALFTDSAVYGVETADPDTARRVLAAYAGCPAGELPAEADGVLARCGGLVLALALVGGMVGEGRPWANVAERLRRAELGRLAGRFADYPHPDLLAALEASVAALPVEAAGRFRELTVFEDRGPVPAAVVARLWQAAGGMDALEADDLLRMFARRSLVQVDPAADAVTVHDLLFDCTRSGLGAATLAALHGVLAADFLGRWGGLAGGLPALRDVAGFDAADGYGVGALVGHLLAAGRRDLVDELLAVEWPTGAGRADNAWYTVHENLGRTGDYLAGVRAVWADAEAETDRAVAAGRDPAGVGREVGCALVVGSIASIAANIPPALLVRLAEEGVWPPSRALAYALATPDLAARARALGDLAPHLPAGLLVRAVEAAAAIDDPYHRAEALGGLAPHLPEDERGPLLARAVEAAAAINDPAHRMLALGDLAPHLPAGLLVRAVEAAAAIDDPYHRAEALGGLAPHLPEDERGPLLVRAVEAAAAIIDDPYHRVETLGGLAPHLPEGERGPLLAQAVDAAAIIDDPYGRAWALRKLAPHLPEDERGPLLAQAVDATAAIDDPYHRAETWNWLAPHLPAGLLARAVEAAAAIDDPDIRAEALGALAPYLPEGERGPLLAQAVEAAAIDDPYHRMRVLRGLAPHLPAGLLVRAVEAAAAIDDPYHRVWELGGLAPHLPEGERGPLLTRVAEAAVENPDTRALVLALGGLAPHLPEGERGPLLVRAVEAAAAIDDPGNRARALGGLAPDLPAGLLVRAVEAAAAIDEPGNRAEALEWLAPHLPAALLVRAVEAAAAIDDPYCRARALGDLARHLPEGERGPLLVRAVDAAAAIDDSYVRAWELEGLARHLPEGERGPLLARAVDAAAAINDPDHRRQALRGLAPHLPAGLLVRAVEAAAAIDDPYHRVWALGGLAPHLPEGERGPLLARAVDAAAAIDDTDHRTLALGGLAPHLPEGERGPLLARAVDAAAAIDEPRVRAWALGVLAPHLPAALLARAVDAAAAIASPFSRALALGWLVPHLPAELLARAVEAATIGDSDARARALGRLAPHLPAELLARAAEAATAIHPDHRAWALGNLAPHLPAELLARVAEAATDDPSARAWALTAIALAENGSRGAGHPRRWRAALRAAAQVNRSSVVAVLPAVLPPTPSTTAIQAARSLVRAQRWWP
jgi:hypothetical protein